MAIRVVHEGRVELEDPRLMKKLHQILVGIERLRAQGEAMSAQLDAVKAEVTRLKDVDEAAIKLIEGLADKIEALKDDPVALQALADEMKGDTDALAKAITDNTPAEG